MTIKFLIQGKTNPSPIYMRLREGREFDLKVKTPLFVDPKNFIDGEIVLNSSPKKGDATIKYSINKQNEDLINLKQKLIDIEKFVLSKVNEDVITYSKSSIESILKEFLNPSRKAAVVFLTDFIDEYILFKKTHLAFSTQKKLSVIKNRIIEFEKIHGQVDIRNVNLEFSFLFQEWADSVDYSHNTKVKTLKVIKTICNYALEKKIKLNPEFHLITKKLAYKKVDHIYLNFEELKLIKNTVLDSDDLNFARDWLLLSCFTAQRISDFLKFDDYHLVKRGKHYFLDVTQEKSKSFVSIPIVEVSLEILEKYNGKFPPLFSNNKGSNETIYNRLIKIVCEKAGINKMERVYMRNKLTNRYEFCYVEKYKAVSSHIGRRSFATNYYGLINTSLLISLTGHSTETQFLRYVGKKENQNAIALANELEKFKI